MSQGVTESVVEEAALQWLAEVGWQVAYGPDVEPEKLGAERDDFTEVVLTRRLRAALERINPQLPPAALDQAVAAVLRLEHPSLIENNRRFHSLLVEGVDVEVKRPDGSTRGDKAWLVDFAHPEANDFLAINQFTVVQDKIKRRPDVVLFVNGLPLGVMELKNPSDEKATAVTAFHQLQTYKQQIPDLFVTQRAAGRLGRHDQARPARSPPTGSGLRRGARSTATVSSRPPRRGLRRWCAACWRRRACSTWSITSWSSKTTARPSPRRWPPTTSSGRSTRRSPRRCAAVAEAGDRRIGVVWHTQGSGKSLSMAFYAGKIVAAAASSRTRRSW